MFEICKNEYFCELEDSELQLLIDEQDKDQNCQEFLENLEYLTYDPVILDEHTDKTIEHVLGCMNYLALSIYQFSKANK